MTRKEYAEKNIGMTFDFIKHLLDHPDAIAGIPDGAEIDFIDKDFCPAIKAGAKDAKKARYRVERVFEQVK